MLLHEFEELWPKRHNLDPSVQKELEHLALTDKDCKAFVDGGDWVRGLCQELDEEPVADNFAYKMQLYAQNNMSEAIEDSSKSWLRWPAITAGLAAGALTMVVVTGSLRQVNNVADPGAPAILANQVIQDSTVEAAFDLAAVDDSLSAKADSIENSRHDTPSPNWDLRTVSAGQ